MAEDTPITRDDIGVVYTDAEGRIVEAVGTAAAVRNDNDLAKRIEAAMSQAVTDALAEGIAMDDTETIKARIMAARSKVLDEAKA